MNQHLLWNMRNLSKAVCKDGNKDLTVIPTPLSYKH